ncbi:hypothetical protein V8C86DRAFT_2512642, partial [Haematococcus lacustris]
MLGGLRVGSMQVAKAGIIWLQAAGVGGAPLPKLPRRARYGQRTEHWDVAAVLKVGILGGEVWCESVAWLVMLGAPSSSCCQVWSKGGVSRHLWISGPTRLSRTSTCCATDANKPCGSGSWLRYTPSTTSCSAESREAGPPCAPPALSWSSKGPLVGPRSAEAPATPCCTAPQLSSGILGDPSTGVDRLLAWCPAQLLLPGPPGATGSAAAWLSRIVQVCAAAGAAAMLLRCPVWACPGAGVTSPASLAPGLGLQQWARTSSEAEVEAWPSARAASLGTATAEACGRMTGAPLPQACCSRVPSSGSVTGVGCERELLGSCCTWLHRVGGAAAGGAHGQAQAGGG